MDLLRKPVDKDDDGDDGRIDKKSDLDAYLHEKLTKKYLPQIEDLVAQKFHSFVNGICGETSCLFTIPRT